MLKYQITLDTANSTMEDQLQLWREEQLRIASKVIIRPDQDKALSGYKYLNTKSDDEDTIPLLLGGVDVSFGENDSAIAVYVVTQDETVIYQDIIEFKLTVPYFSSYLAFREIEPLTQLVMKQKKIKPEVTPAAILVDGNGIFHERGAGIASFLGVRTNMKTIGVGKTLYCMDGLDHAIMGNGLEEKLDTFLTGRKNKKPDSQQNKREVVIMTESSIQPQDHCHEEIKKHDNTTRCPFKENIQLASQYCEGFAVPIRGKSGSILAAALVGHGGKIGQRASSTKARKGGTKIPIFISIGHDISLQEAVQICASTSYARIPESVRRADLIGRQIMRGKNMS